MPNSMSHSEYHLKTFLSNHGRGIALSLAFLSASGAGYGMYTDFARGHQCDLKEQAARLEHKPLNYYTAGMDCDTSPRHIEKGEGFALFATFGFLTLAFRAGHKKIGEKHEHWYNHLLHHEEKHSLPNKVKAPKPSLKPQLLALPKPKNQ